IQVDINSVYVKQIEQDTYAARDEENPQRILDVTREEGFVKISSTNFKRILMSCLKQ
ncbi:hypothetical protein MKW94_015200, partial [Papaver nudicaule]|nr:hypothetical protein [Papaver nudicaule]